METINTALIGDSHVSSVQLVQAASVQTSSTASTGFATALRTLVCPKCNSLFGAQVLSQSPKMTPHTVVEADFHRLVPHVSFRGALVTICPACDHAGWVQDFAEHSFPADMVPAASDLEPSIKYAYAIKKGRESNSPALNLALLSLNGLWCARQENKSTAPWLELTIKELTAALDDKSWRGNRSYYTYLRGELKRQNSDFEGSLRDFEQAVPQVKVPRELIEKQKQLAESGNNEPTLIPSHLVQQIFCLAPSVAVLPQNEKTETIWKI